MPSVLNLGRIKPVWKGAWNAAVAYVADDMVSYMGHSYICVQPHTGVAPALAADNAHWNVLALGQTVLSSRGDLMWHNGTGVARLPVGGVGTVLRVGQNNALSWGLLDGKPSATAARLAEHPGNGGGWQNNGFISPDGTAKVWGIAGLGSNGDGGQNNVFVPRPLTFLVRPPNPRVRQLVLAGRSAYAVMENGWVYSWGGNISGQLGHGDTTNRGFPTRIEFFVQNNIQIARVITAAGRHNLNTASETMSTFFLDTLGRLYAVGNNASGQLGVGDTNARLTPVRVGTFEGITDVTLCFDNTLASSYLLQGGNLFVTGYNQQGQLGLGDTVNRSAFTLVSGLTNVTKVAASCSYNSTAATAFGGFAIALRADGTVWSAGFNSSGQLGVGDANNRSSFVQVSGLTGVVDVGCSSGYNGYSWAVTQAGLLATWGNNSQGALGLGDTVNKTSPVFVDQWHGDHVTAGSGQSTPPFNGKIKKVVAGGIYGSHNLTVLTTDGLLFTAGMARGATAWEGLATTYNRFRPWLQHGLPEGVQVLDIVVAGIDNEPFSTLLLSDGRVMTTGNNANGVLGYNENNVSNHQQALQLVQA